MMVELWLKPKCLNLGKLDMKLLTILNFKYSNGDINRLQITSNC